MSQPWAMHAYLLLHLTKPLSSIVDRFPTPHRVQVSLAQTLADRDVSGDWPCEAFGGGYKDVRHTAGGDCDSEFYFGGSCCHVSRGSKEKKHIRRLS